MEFESMNGYTQNKFVVLEGVFLNIFLCYLSPSATYLCFWHVPVEYRRVFINAPSLYALFHNSAFTSVNLETGADLVFLIWGDTIQKKFCQILGNYSKEFNFL